MPPVRVMPVETRLTELRSSPVEESKKEASDRLKRSFVLSRFAELEGIDVSDDDVDKKLSEMFSNAEEEIPESSQNAQMRDYLSRSIVMEETMKKLEQIASGTPDAIDTNEKTNEDNEKTDDEDDIRDEEKDHETEEGETND